MKLTILLQLELDTLSLAVYNYTSLKKWKRGSPNSKDSIHAPDVSERDSHTLLSTPGAVIQVLISVTLGFS